MSHIYDSLSYRCHLKVVRAVLSKKSRKKCILSATSDDLVAIYTEKDGFFTAGTRFEAQTDSAVLYVPQENEIITRIDVVAIASSCHNLVVLGSDAVVYLIRNLSRHTINGEMICVTSNSQRLSRTVPFAGMPTITCVACGEEHILFADVSGLVWSCGTGMGVRYAQGHGTNMHVLADDNIRPRRIESLNHLKIIGLGAGSASSFVVTDSGKVFVFGTGANGSLGIGDTDDAAVPQQVQGLGDLKVSTVVGHSSFLEHSAILTDDGNVYTFGCGMHGQLGHGGTEDETTPRKVNLPGVVITSVQLCYMYTVICSSNGQVYTFGSNEGGRLGYDQAADQLVPKLVEGLLTGVNVCQVAAGAYSMYTLTQDARVYKFGSNPNREQSTPLFAPIRFKRHSLGTNQAEAIEIQVCSPTISMQQVISDQYASHEDEASGSEADSFGSRNSPQSKTSEASTQEYDFQHSDMHIDQVTLEVA